MWDLCLIEGKEKYRSEESLQHFFLHDNGIILLFRKKIFLGIIIIVDTFLMVNIL